VNAIRVPRWRGEQALLGERHGRFPSRRRSVVFRLGLGGPAAGLDRWAGLGGGSATDYGSPHFGSEAARHSKVSLRTVNPLVSGFVDRRQLDLPADDN
jgi:hypothetical protein